MNIVKITPSREDNEREREKADRCECICGARHIIPVRVTILRRVSGFGRCSFRRVIFSCWSFARAFRVNRNMAVAIKGAGVGVCVSALLLLRLLLCRNLKNKKEDICI